MSDTIIVRRDGQAPLRIRGTLLGKVVSSMESASPDYSGGAGRCERVRVYKTAGGKYVVAVTHETCWQGEHDSYEAAVYPSLTQCISYLSDRIPNWMLQDLIKALGEEEVAEEVK